jgi:hypothetical protein
MFEFIFVCFLFDSFAAFVSLFSFGNVLSTALTYPALFRLQYTANFCQCVALLPFVLLMCPAVCYLNVTVIRASLIVVSHSGMSARTAYVSRRINLVDLCLCRTLCLINMQASFKRLFPWSKILLQKLTVTLLVNKTQCQSPRSDTNESSPHPVHFF